MLAAAAVIPLFTVARGEESCSANRLNLRPADDVSSADWFIFTHYSD
jgi:hypothetical protein